MNHEFFKFLVTGGGATSAHYAVFWLCISVIGINATMASAVGYLFGSVVSYLMNYYYTFHSRRPHGEAVMLFYLMVTMGFFVNIGSVHALTSELGLNPWLSQVFATGLTLFSNFFFSKVFVFGWRGR